MVADKEEAWGTASVLDRVDKVAEVDNMVADRVVDKGKARRVVAVDIPFEVGIRAWVPLDTWAVLVQEAADKDADTWVVWAV